MHSHDKNSLKKYVVDDEKKLWSENVLDHEKRKN